MSDVFREIDEEVRRDKALQFWNKYQNWIIAAAILVVVGAGSWRYWQYQNRVASEAAGLRFENAIQLERTGKIKEAEQAFAEIGKSGAHGYRMLARMREAAAAAGRNASEGVKLFEAIAAEQTFDPLVRDAARLRAAMLQLDAGVAFPDLQKNLSPLAAPTGAYRHSARELLALGALKAGDYAAAGKWLDMVMADPQAPAALRQRAVLLQAIVGSGAPPAK